MREVSGNGYRERGTVAGQSGCFACSPYPLVS